MTARVLGKWLWMLLVFVFVVAAVAGLPAMAAKTGLDSAAREYLEVKEIRIQGLETIPQQDVMNLLSLNPGTNIFMVNLEEAGRRLETHPLVASVGIKRSIPSTLEIRVEERRPYYLLKVGEKTWVMDKTGVAISENSDPSAKRDLATILAPGLMKMKIRPGIRVTLAGFSQMVSVARGMKDFRLFGKYEFLFLRALDRERLEIQFKGTNVKLVAPRKGWTDEIERLRTVEYTLKGRENKIDSIDLCFANKVVVEFAADEKKTRG